MWDEFGTEVLATDPSSTTMQPPTSDTDAVSVMDSSTRGGGSSGWEKWSQGALDKLLGTWANVRQADAIGQTYRAQSQIDPRTGQPYVAQRYMGNGAASLGVAGLNTQTLLLIGAVVLGVMMLKKA